MTRIEVFDPPMCCSTGVCGPDVDPKLVQFSADLEWAENKGVDVARFNLSQEPSAFVANADVQAALKEGGNDALPLVLIDGNIACRGFYPQREQLQAMLKLEAFADDGDKEESSGGCGGSTSCC